MAGSVEGADADGTRSVKTGTLTILSTGSIIHYVVPSFPIYNAELVEIKVQWEEEDRSLLVFDALPETVMILITAYLQSLKYHIASTISL